VRRVGYNVPVRFAWLARMVEKRALYEHLEA
jgi:hypothetical protein